MVQLMAIRARRLPQQVIGSIIGYMRAISAPLPVDARRRIVFVALALLLQSLADLPWNILHTIAGPLDPLLNIGLLLGSIALIIAAVAGPMILPRQRLARFALIVSLFAGVIGFVQLGKSVVASFTRPLYSNDGTTLDHEAALVLLRGGDPYTATNILQALHDLNQNAEFTTPLHQGQFATRDWLRYPSPDTLRATAAARYGAPTAPEFEGRVSYPSFAILPLIPFVALGLPSVVIVSLLFLGLFAWFALRAVDPAARPWLGLLILADVPLMNSVMTGALDVQLLALTFLFWLWWERPWLATLILGLDLATKQQAWFFALFFFVFLWQRVGWRATIVRFLGAMAIFLALNLPFIVHNAQAWSAGVLAPLLDPMFPRGRGLIQFALAGWLPLWPTTVYSALELLALGLALGWYIWRGARRYPALGLILAMIPLWFAWRSLTSYFYFAALPTIALWLAWHQPAAVAESPHVSNLTDDRVSVEVSR